MRRWAAITLLILGACGGAGADRSVEETTIPPVPTLLTTTTSTAATPDPTLVALEEGLPRTGNYSFLEVTVTEAVLGNVEPRSFLSNHVASPNLYLFLNLSLLNGSDSDVANWVPTPFGLQVDGAALDPPEVLVGRPNIGLTQRNSVEMLLAFAVPEGTTFEQSALTIAEVDRIPMVLPLVGEVLQPGYPLAVEVSGTGPARGRGPGCNQDIEVTMLDGQTGIDLLGGEYPTAYGSRRARVGDRFLTVGIRVHNHGGSRCGGGGTNFGIDDVRLVTDGIPREPITWVNTAIGLETAQDLNFDFVYPVDVSDLEITVGSETADYATAVALPQLPRAPGE